MESLRHFNGVRLLERILLLDDWTIVYHDGDYSIKIQTPLGEREYWPDIVAQRGDEQVIFELDGWKGHSTKTDFAKMAMRDKELLAQKGIRTVRLHLDDIIGKKKQPVELIKAEINFQLFTTK